MEDNSYRKGTVDAKIDMIIKRLDSFGRKLDDNLEWQRGVDERLTTGITKFESLDDDVKALEGRDRIVGIFSAAVAFIAGIFGSRQ